MSFIYKQRLNIWLPLLVTSILAMIVIFVIIINVETPLVVLSGHSMIPTLRPGDLVLLHKADILEVQVNDLIAYGTTNQTIVVHRVVEKSVDRSGQIHLTAKGDSNQWNDKEQIDQHNYIGRVYSIWPKAGLVITTLQNPMILILSALVIAAFIIYQRSHSNDKLALTQ